VTKLLGVLKRSVLKKRCKSSLESKMVRKSQEDTRFAVTLPAHFETRRRLIYRVPTMQILRGQEQTFVLTRKQKQGRALPSVGRNGSGLAPIRRKENGRFQEDAAHLWWKWSRRMRSGRRGSLGSWGSWLVRRRFLRGRCRGVRSPHTPKRRPELLHW